MERDKNPKRHKALLLFQYIGWRDQLTGTPIVFGKILFCLTTFHPAKFCLNRRIRETTGDIVKRSCLLSPPSPSPRDAAPLIKLTGKKEPQIETGEHIKVTLDTTGGQKLTQDNGTFTVNSSGGDALTLGVFLLEEQTESYFDNLPSSDKVTILEQNALSGMSYIFYTYSDAEASYWNYVIKLDSAVTGIGLTNEISQKSAEEVFALLDFEKVAE